MKTHRNILLSAMISIKAETQKGIRKQIVDTDICWYVRKALEEVDGE